MINIRSLSLPLAGLIGIFALGACTSAPPTVQTGPDAEVSFDGLHKVDNARADEAWARPDFNLSAYDSIMITRPTIEYRPVRNRGNTSISRSSGGPYFIDSDARARFEQLVEDVFREELGKIENFDIVTEAGPGTLIIQGGVLDVVSFVPPDISVGRSDIYIRSIGEATLVLELRDSETGTILARAVDRRAAENRGDILQESNRATNTMEVRRLLRFWAGRLRESLDGFAAT